MNNNFFLQCLLVVLFPTISWCNNIQVLNPAIASVNTASQYAIISFDVSWENSWRDASNYDAAWLFIKCRLQGSTASWSHATLNYVDGTNDGHTPPSNGSLRTSPDGKGVFLYRSINGNGNVSFTNVKLRWNFGANGYSNLITVNLKIFGIEMVYVPGGGFYLGDGQTNLTEVYGNFESSNTGSPFQITSEGSLTLGGSGSGSLGNNNRNQHFGSGWGGSTFDCGNDGCMGGSGDDFSDVTIQTLPANFPKGFNAFYCMKYEMTQEQFVDMMNTLTSTQQNTYLSSTSNFYPQSGNYSPWRYGITQTGGLYTTSTPYLPMIYCDWIKAAAYADWAALRPMTELEFEKACRGTSSSVINEYAWGNANADLSDNFTLSNIDLANESIASGYNSGGTSGNLWIRTGAQSMNNLARVGIFSAHASNNGRVTSGATFWGIMEMSGNAWERAVSVGHPEGRKFTGLHGDGILDANGYANVSNWPGTFSGSSVQSNIGVGYRGGGLAYPNPNLQSNARISSRRLASAYFNIVINDDGTRFVRSAN